MSAPKKSKDFIRYEGQKWGAVPVSAWSAHVSLPAKALFSLLWTFVGGEEDFSVWPSQELLADLLGVRPNTISKHLGELEQAGCLIRRYRAKVDKAWHGNPAARLYELVLPEPYLKPTHANAVVGHTRTRKFDTRERTTEQNNEQTSQEGEKSVVVPSGQRQTPKFFQEALEAAKAKGIRNPVGYALGMLKHGWKPQEAEKPPDYIGGKYAGIVKH
jgi:DNA-binding Lrp family transcriptional regulator